jgi:hypothetical protein
LHLILETRHRSVSIDDQRRRQKRFIHDALGSQYDHHAGFRSGRCNRRPCVLEETSVWNCNLFPGSSVSRNIAFRKADEIGAMRGRLVDSSFR